MSAQEQAGETEVLLDSSTAVITRIENALFGPAPAVNSASTIGPKGGALMGLLEENRTKLSALLGRLQTIESALANNGLKASANIR